METKKEIFQYHQYLKKCMKNPQLFIELTSKCNFRCFYCNSINSPRKQFMDEQLFYHIVDQIHELTNQQVRLHMDGEPTLHKKFEEFAHAINSRGHVIALATNGSLLKENYLDIEMHIIVNLSCSKEELAGRTNMDFDKYIKILSSYVKSWLRHYCKQNINYCLYHTREDRMSSERLQAKYDFVLSFLRLCGFNGNIELKNNSPNLFIHRKEGGGIFQISQSNVASGGLYPNTAGITIKRDLPKDVGFCDSPWKRLIILSNGQLGYCCIDLSGSLAYTDPSEIWNSSVKTLWMNNEKINKIRAEMLSNKINHSVCQLCLDRISSRELRVPFQLTFKEFCSENSYV